MHYDYYIFLFAAPHAAIQLNISASILSWERVLFPCMMPMHEKKVQLWPTLALGLAWQVGFVSEP
jgi:hypothetical protein